MKKIVLAGIGFAAALAGCARDAPLESAAPPGEARAQVRDATGRVLAQAAAVDAAEGVRVRVEAAGLAPGTYAAHIHTVGRCEPPGFESAGPHWNPTERQHGTQNPLGPHMGDLPNLLVGADGEGRFEFTVPGARLGGGELGLLDADGSAVVIHANPDDYRTDPSGNSGARIACGVLG